MVLSLGDALTAIAGWLERRQRRAERDDAAIRSLLLAVNETKRYIARYRRGPAPPRDQEGELVRLWTEAAVAVRHVDPVLAGRLQMKAEYWADPTSWTDRDIRTAGIRIEEIAAAARAQLRAGGSGRAAKTRSRKK